MKKGAWMAVLCCPSWTKRKSNFVHSSRHNLHKWYTIKIFNNEEQVVHKILYFTVHFGIPCHFTITEAPIFVYFLKTMKWRKIIIRFFFCILLGIGHTSSSLWHKAIGPIYLFQQWVEQKGLAFLHNINITRHLAWQTIKDCAWTPFTSQLLPHQI